MLRRTLKPVARMLLRQYGPQGWWPLTSFIVLPDNPGGYHPEFVPDPMDRSVQFEVALGAVLTQNITWRQAWQAVLNLQEAGVLHEPARLLALPDAALADAVRPARFVNSKSRYLRNMAEFFLGLPPQGIPSRDDLLAVTGIGPETADSILLYGFQSPEFVVDAYTKRIGMAAGWFDERTGYAEMKAFFTARLPVDLRLYNEVHALLVAHGAAWYSRQPWGAGDPLLRRLRRYGK